MTRKVEAERPQPIEPRAYRTRNNLSRLEAALKRFEEVNAFIRAKPLGLGPDAPFMPLHVIGGRRDVQHELDQMTVWTWPAPYYVALGHTHQATMRRPA